jgi:hypothetical protein
MYDHFLEKGLPTLYTTQIFLGLCLFEAVLAMILPGPHVKGLPIPHEGGRQLDYKCNGVISLYTTYLVSAALHYSGVWRLTEVRILLSLFRWCSVTRAVFAFFVYMCICTFLFRYWVVITGNAILVFD